MPKWFVALGLIWALCAYGISLGYSARSGGLVADYCAYGAVSRAQLDGCIERVGESDIRKSSTSAARFARRDIDAGGDNRAVLRGLPQSPTL